MKGLIYIIRSHQTNDTYYGSTTQLLCKRIATHRQDYKKFLNGKHQYMTSFDIMVYDDAYIELIEEVEFTNKNELYAREGFHIRNNICVNKNIMGRTHAERYELNKEHIKDVLQKWRVENKEHVKEYRKIYNEKHREEQKEQKAKYNKDNAEHIRERERKYQLEHKDEISANRRRRYQEKKAMKR
jgi:hypothetical protein